MNERIRLTVVALDEAEALHGVEELDGARCLLAGQLALRTAAEAAAAILAGRALRNRKRIALDLEVGRRHLAAAIDEGEGERLAFGKTGEARLLDCRNMDEHILAAIVTNDEAEALLSVEEFYDALAFADDLGVVPDLGSHIISMARYLVGDIVAVCGACETIVKDRPIAPGAKERRPVTVEDQGRALLRFASGAGGSFEASWVRTGRLMQLAWEIIGRTGSLTFTAERLNELKLYKAGAASPSLRLSPS